MSSCIKRCNNFEGGSKTLSTSNAESLIVSKLIFIDILIALSDIINFHFCKYNWANRKIWTGVDIVSIKHFKVSLQ